MERRAKKKIIWDYLTLRKTATGQYVLFILVSLALLIALPTSSASWTIEHVDVGA